MLNGTMIEKNGTNATEGEETAVGNLEGMVEER